PKLPGILAAEAKLDRLRALRYEIRCGIRQHFFEFSVRLVHIDLAIFVSGDVIPPTHLASFPIILAGKINFLLRRIYSLETLSAGVIERTDHFPFSQETEELPQVHRLSELFELFRKLIDLLYIAGRIQGLLKEKRCARSIAHDERPLG